MSFSCLHEINGFCHRLHKECQPTTRGCVIEGKMFRAMDLFPDEFIIKFNSKSEDYLKEIEHIHNLRRK